jgi:hypothetical protein
MYTERYSIPFLAGVLISAADRRRPGLGAWNEGLRGELRTVFETELAELKRQFLELFDDRIYWEKVERTLLEVCFPRYCALAQKQTELEQSNYRLWRGGDLVARGTYAAAGLFIGILMVKLPFIPIPQTWDLFAFLTMIGAPFIPELQIWMHRRRYRKGLEAIVADMRDAEQQLRMYQPLQEPKGAQAIGAGSAAEDSKPEATVVRNPTSNRG